MNFPPVVKGVTEQSGSPDSGAGGIGALLQTLLFARGGGGETSLAYVQQAIELLEKAARNDPRIAPRVVKALELLETDSNDDGRRDKSGPKSSEISSMFGGIHSPV